MKISDLWKRQIAVPLWAIAVIMLALGVLTYGLMMPSRENREAMKVEQWKRRPVVTICEPRPGEQIVLGRQVPTGPGAEPDAEPVQFVIRMQGCEVYSTPSSKEQHDER